MRYFIHLNAGLDRFSDDVGKEFADFASARAEAMEAVREIISLKLQRAEFLSPAWSVEVADPHGKVLETLSFAQVVFGASFELVPSARVEEAAIGRCLEKAVAEAATR